MATSTTRLRIDLGELSTLFPRESPQPPQKKRRLGVHRWTREEVNIISYLRLHRDWSWRQIHRTFFSSISIGAVKIAFFRIPPEERVRRASVISARNKAIERPHFRREPETPSTKASEKCTTNSANTARYNLRPKRPKSFTENTPPCLIDRSRFPHFAKAYKNHQKQHKAPDENYSPPSRSPTPESSDYSPSVALSYISDASSLELFGLEVRPISPLGLNPSVVPSSPSDDFLSAEEYPASP